MNTHHTHLNREIFACLIYRGWYFFSFRDLLDEARDYHLMPERRSLLQTFKTRPRCCSDIPGIIYAIGGLTSSGFFYLFSVHVIVIAV